MKFENGGNQNTTPTLESLQSKITDLEIRVQQAQALYDKGELQSSALEDVQGQLHLAQVALNDFETQAH